jgi:hypothetical protein
MLRRSIRRYSLKPCNVWHSLDAWTFGLNTESTYNWTSNEWSVPINLTATKLTKIDNQPISIGGGGSAIGRRARLAVRKAWARVQSWRSYSPREGRLAGNRRRDRTTANSHAGRSADVGRSFAVASAAHVRAGSTAAKVNLSKQSLVYRERPLAELTQLVVYPSVVDVPSLHAKITQSPAIRWPFVCHHSGWTEAL